MHVRPLAIIGFVVLAAVPAAREAAADCQSECSYYSSCSESCWNGEAMDTCQNFPPCGDGGGGNVCPPQNIDNSEIRRRLDNVGWSPYVNAYVCITTSTYRNWYWDPCRHEMVPGCRTQQDSSVYVQDPQHCEGLVFDSGLSCWP